MTHDETDRDAAVDELAARQLDDAQPITQAEFAGLADVARHRMADLLWLDTLLVQLERPAQWAADQDRRVGRTLALLASEPLEVKLVPGVQPAEFPVPTHRRVVRPARRLWWSGLLTAAAALLIAFLLRSGSPRSQAYAAVDQVVAVAHKPIDRQYRVRVDLAGEHAAESTLYVRGGEKFCLKHPAPLGVLWLGGDRQQSWLVPALPFLPVRVSHDPKLIREFLREGDVSLTPQVLQVTSILSRLADRERYELELRPAEQIHHAPDKSKALLERIHGRRREASGIWPETVDLWADPQSGQMKRMVLQWRPDAAIQRITLELAGEEPQPDDWYEHTRHHQPGRTILEGASHQLQQGQEQGV